jgi:hypothetical protein
MWIFTKHGFFSAVCARQGKGEHGQPISFGRWTTLEVQVFGLGNSEGLP